MSDKPTNDGGPAFPAFVPDGTIREEVDMDARSVTEYPGGKQHSGMSLLDYFAAHAPAEIWPWIPVDWEFDEPSPYKNVPITRVPTESEEREYQAWSRRRDAAAQIVGRWAYADAMVKASGR